MQQNDNVASKIHKDILISNYVLGLKCIFTEHNTIFNLGNWVVVKP